MYNSSGADVAAITTSAASWVAQQSTMAPSTTITYAVREGAGVSVYPT